MRITPEVIPHKDFHKGSWLARRSFSEEGLLSPENPFWYYFLKRPRQYRIPAPPFLQSVDEPLRELVTFLHERNIPTTPSCSGHHTGKKEFHKIYKVLEEDQKKINHSGLLLTDVETGKKLVYREKAYVLPWDREEFIARVKRQQEKGILGICLPKRKMRNRMLGLNVDGVEVYERDGIVFIGTQNHPCWKKVTPAVKKIVREYESVMWKHLTAFGS